MKTGKWTLITRDVPIKSGDYEVKLDIKGVLCHPDIESVAYFDAATGLWDIYETDRQYKVRAWYREFEERGEM